VLLLDQGVALEVVSAVLGHSKLSVTADVYARVTQDAKRRRSQGLTTRLGDD
jgi:site-specific recombinase XerD